MTDQHEIVKKLVSEMGDQFGQMPSSIEPKTGESFRYVWKLTTESKQSVYGMYQIGDWFYIRAITKQFSDMPEKLALMLVNELNDICHYGVFYRLPDQQGFSVEQNHFIRSSPLALEEIAHMISQLYGRVTELYATAAMVMNENESPSNAVLKFQSQKRLKQ